MCVIDARIHENGLVALTGSLLLLEVNDWDGARPLTRIICIHLPSWIYLCLSTNAFKRAAGQEWEPYWQRRLLNAAKFRRGFLDLHNPTDFVNMGQTLKVLNAVRFYEIGSPLTHLQYIYASPSHLTKRLTARNTHLLALRISTFLSMKPDAVLKHWTSAKILYSRPSATGTGTEADVGGDDAVCKLIVDKFEQLGGGREREVGHQASGPLAEGGGPSPVATQHEGRPPGFAQGFRQRRYRPCVPCLTTFTQASPAGLALPTD
ncbi:hypothetical protein FB45DRAFT_865494 [Roridomyces roridus]|uniref:Uncharacterized protein n=1 Tax=Roridomyces roridus TaxID=1738132 RepID=A0AAD7FSC6_9AGAR|nr:hypothetical protein FB45DRAFT_865494 [Roridomyces roridus]